MLAIDNIRILPLSPTSIIGRQHELALIWKQYEVAKGGMTRIVLVTGEPGIGKTRILHEVTRRAVLDGAIALHGGASEAEGMPPYQPFLEALGGYIRTAPPDLLRTQATQAPQLIASILPELPVPPGDSYPLPLEQARFRLHEAVGTFLQAIGTSQVLVLALDDLHWVDSASLDLLCHLARRQSRAHLLIVGAYRDNEIEQNSALRHAVVELSRQRALSVVEVSPLSAHEIEALAVKTLGQPVSSSLSSILYAQSEGNPFFAEELLHGWIETGALVQKHDHWAIATSFEQSLPPSIVGALRQRFMRLSPDIIEHLRIAAVIGRTFDLMLLCAVVENEIEAVEERLLEAERAHLIRSVQAGIFTFSHDKIRECLYAEVSASRRKRLRGMIGQALDLLGQDEQRRNELLLGLREATLLVSKDEEAVHIGQLPHLGRLSLPANLTQREAEVLQLVAQGRSNRQIACKLTLSEKTVANHLTHIFSKISCNNRAAAVAFAIRHSLA